MAQKNEFVEYVTADLLMELEGVSSRAMFGGYGIYVKGIIVGIIVDDELYLKVDESNKAEYQKMKSKPFVYKAKGGKKMEMSYWKIPADILEDQEELVRLAVDSYEINLKKAGEKENSKKSRKLNM